MLYYLFCGTGIWGCSWTNESRPSQSTARREKKNFGLWNRREQEEGAVPRPVGTATLWWPASTTGMLLVTFWVCYAIWNSTIKFYIFGLFHQVLQLDIASTQNLKFDSRTWLYIYTVQSVLVSHQTVSRLLSSPNIQSGKYNEMDTILIGTAVSEHVIKEMSKPAVPLVKALWRTIILLIFMITSWLIINVAVVERRKQEITASCWCIEIYRKMHSAYLIIPLIFIISVCER